jgi:hypothetical protein
VNLVPIPVTDEYIKRFFPHWFPFLPDIAKRSKETVVNLAAQIVRKEVQPILIWDDQAERAVALLGIRYHRRNDDLIAELIWTTGKGMKQWTHLLADLERYLSEHIGCHEIRPICRPGWSRLLKQRGYRITHYTMEKRLKE